MVDVFDKERRNKDTVLDRVGVSLSGTNVFLEKEGMAWDRRGDADAVGVRDQGDRSEMGEVRSGAEE